MGALGSDENPVAASSSELPGAADQSSSSAEALTEEGMAR